MTNPNKTELVLVVDESESMLPLYDAVLRGVNGLLDAQRDQPGACRVSLVTFSSTYRWRIDTSPLVTVKNLGEGDYQPRGRTLYYDTLAQVIWRIGHYLALEPEHERPGTVIVATMTDGHDNESRMTRTELAAKVVHQRQVYNWQFMFLAANLDAAAEATSLGMDPQLAVSYQPTRAGTQSALSTLSANITRARTRG